MGSQVEDVRLGERAPEDTGGTRPSGPLELVLETFSKNPLGKPSEGTTENFTFCSSRTHSFVSDIGAKGQGR